MVNYEIYNYFINAKSKIENFWNYSVSIRTSRVKTWAKNLIFGDAGFLRVGSLDDNAQHRKIANCP